MVWLCGCVPALLSTPPSTTPTHHADAPAEARSPEPTLRCENHSVTLQSFAIHQDGRDIGREIRSTWEEDGPFGAERVALSHMVRQFQRDDLAFDRATIISQRLLKEDNTLLRNAFVTMDEGGIWLSLVGFDGEGWQRIHEEKRTIRKNIRTKPTDLDLPAEVLIGFDLNAHMRLVALGQELPQEGMMHYVARMQAPLTLDILPPTTEILAWQQQHIEGHRVMAVHAGTDRVWLSLFVSTDGIVLEERYPQLHQVRTLAPGAPTRPTQTANPIVGLHSDTYLALPELSTKNRYQVVSDCELTWSEISFLDEPANQHLESIDAQTFSLTVQAGGPSGSVEPTSRDLDDNRYIETASPLITQALQYLKSAGAEGQLPPHRKENALAVVSELGQLAQRSAIWKSPDQTARWLMRYVYGILPDKTHTHTMKTATQALLDGQGDCTEHSVLFAALMRAAGIPTRLVSGVYLTRGGAWVYHMWNEYWDGHRWQSIDTAVGPTFRTGAHYIALGPGVSDFADHRDKIAFFLDTAFSGFAIYLTEATANGQILHLVTPTRHNIALSDKTIFAATTALKRGEAKQALQIVTQQSRSEHPPLQLQILTAELLYQNERYDEALHAIHALRRITSLPVNVVFLDRLEHRILLDTKRFREAESIVKHLCTPAMHHLPGCAQMRASGLAAEGAFSEALEILEHALAQQPDDIELRTAVVALLAHPGADFSAEEQQRGIAMGRKLLIDTHYADSDALIALTQLLLRTQHVDRGTAKLFHTQLLVPGNPALQQWRRTIIRQCPNHFWEPSLPPVVPPQH
ncbi:MAG: lasso peptide biosynthesis protein [Proteobacteria bacterium]|nr:lasso peptide biosynthesis protein [Pseudomonadota bacterium]